MTNEKKLVTVEDLWVRRTQSGALVPIRVPVPALGMDIEVLPTTVGSVKGLTCLDRQTHEWPPEERAQYLINHVTSPDLSGFSAEELLDNMTVWDIDHMVVAAVNAGGPLRRTYEGNGVAR